VSLRKGLRPLLRVQPGNDRQCADQSVLDRGHYSGLHRGSGVAVPRPVALSLRCLLAWPISSSITREGMPASSSQVANVCRRSCGPCNSRSASGVSRGVGSTADQRGAPPSSPGLLAATPAVSSRTRAASTVAGVNLRPCPASQSASWSTVYFAPSWRSAFRTRMGVGGKPTVGSPILAMASRYARRRL
jgi:hypothetical protein